MSAPINDGGPAFPVPSVAWKEKGEDRVAIGTRGMTLRTYLAGQALAGLCVPSLKDGPITDWEFDKIAPVAWKAADAMLAAQEAKP